MPSWSKHLTCFDHDGKEEFSLFIGNLWSYMLTWYMQHRVHADLEMHPRCLCFPLSVIYLHCAF